MKAAKKKTKKKTPDFLSLNKKYLNGRPKSKKFGLVDTEGLGRKNSNFNSTDNLLLGDQKKKKKTVSKKKSVKPTDVFSDQDALERGRQREEEMNKNKRMAEVTPPANLYAVNINVKKK